MKDKILIVAAEVMNQRGVKFTVDSVVQKLGISKKTLYQYISSKDELIHLLVEAAINDMIAQQEKILASETGFVKKLKAVLTIQPRIFGHINDWVFEDIKNHCPSAWEDVEKFRRTRMQVIIDILDIGQANGELRCINSRLAAQALRGAMREMMEYKFLSAENMTLDDAFEGVSDMFINGILQKKELKESQAN